LVLNSLEVGSSVLIADSILKLVGLGGVFGLLIALRWAIGWGGFVGGWGCVIRSRLIGCWSRLIGSWGRAIGGRVGHGHAHKGKNCQILK
jgi:hypothetical protein